MNYNFPKIESIETQAAKKVVLSGSTLLQSFQMPESNNGTLFVDPQNVYASGRICNFRISHGSLGEETLAFPQLVLQCASADIRKMQESCVEWLIGGCTICAYDWQLVRLLNQLRTDSPLAKIKSRAIDLYSVLRKAGMYQHVANTVVAFALLQHKEWAPYTWMLNMSHEMAEIEQFFKPQYLIPLCLPFGTDRFIPQYHVMDIRVWSLPGSLTAQPKLQFMKGPNATQQERERVVNIFMPLHFKEFQPGMSESKTLSLDLLASRAGYCLLIRIDGDTNIDQFRVEILYKNNRFDAISGSLASAAIGGCKNWYGITTDEKLDVPGAANMQRISDGVKYLNFTPVDDSRLIFSNSAGENIIKPQGVEAYWQHLNVLRDKGGVAGLMFVQ